MKIKTKKFFMFILALIYLIFMIPTMSLIPILERFMSSNLHVETMQVSANSPGIEIIPTDSLYRVESRLYSTGVSYLLCCKDSTIDLRMAEFSKGELQENYLLETYRYEELEILLGEVYWGVEGKNFKMFNLKIASDSGALRYFTHQIGNKSASAIPYTVNRPNIFLQEELDCMEVPLIIIAPNSWQGHLDSLDYSIISIEDLKELSRTGDIEFMYLEFKRA